MLNAIFDTIGDALAAIGSMFSEVFASATSLFYNSVDGLTTLGTLALVGVAMGLFMFGFYFILKLLRLHR